MKRLLLAALLLGLPGSGGARTLEEPKLAWGRGDTNAHMIVGCLGTAGLAEFFRQRGYPEWKSVLFGSVLVGVAAVVKEFGHDSFASSSDLQAGALGIAAGAGIHYSIRF